MYISLFALVNPVNYTSEFWELFKATMCNAIVTRLIFQSEPLDVVCFQVTTWFSPL